MNVDYTAWFISVFILYTELYSESEFHKGHFHFDSLRNVLILIHCVLSSSNSSHITLAVLCCTKYFTNFTVQSKKIQESETVKEFQLMSVHFIMTDPKMSYHILFSIAGYYVDLE